MTTLSRSTAASSAPASLIIAVLLLAPGRAYANCDRSDGSVVAAARLTLDSDDAGRVLIWVQKDIDARAGPSAGAAA